MFSVLQYTILTLCLIVEGILVFFFLKATLLSERKDLLYITLT